VTEPRLDRAKEAPAPERRAEPSTRSGFVALAGRPNVGKSTLLNRIVGEKVAIASERPQTTRRAIRGIVTAERWQAVLVDLPGIQRPRDLLTERMQQRMWGELERADAVLLVLDGTQRVGPGDRFIAHAIRAAGIPPVTAVNKRDLLDRAATAAALAAAAELELEGEIFPVSARTGAGVPELLAALTDVLPAAPLLYPPGEATDLPGRVRVAELVREQVLRRTRDELPHAVEVEVEEVEERPGGPLVIRARVWAETESQKAILIGAGGRMVRDVGTAARREIEALLGRRVHLDLGVRARRGWRRDEALLDRLGIE
jgi:GTP-binding protein Era